MAGQIRHLKEKSGRFYPRLAIPEKLRQNFDETQLPIPLGGDRHMAPKRLPAAVSVMQALIEEALKAANISSSQESFLPAPFRLSDALRKDGLPDQRPFRGHADPAKVMRTIYELYANI